MRHFLDPHERFFQGLLQGHQARVHRSATAQCARRARQQLVGVAFLRFIQTFERAAGGLRQAAAVGDARALFDEGRELSFAELHGVQLLYLVAQQVEPGVPIAGGGFHRDTAVHQRQPGGVRGAHLAGERVELPETVEQFALRGGTHQGLKFVLTVNVEQQFADGAQDRDRHALAVEPGAAPSVGADDPAQQQLVLGGNRVFLEHVLQRPAHPRDIDRRAQIAPLRTGAHHFGTGPPAAEQFEGVDQDRLAGTGLTSEYGEPGAEVDFHRFDDRQVADLQMAQHGFSAPAPFRRGPSGAWSAAGGNNRSRADGAR